MFDKNLIFCNIEENSFKDIIKKLGTQMEKMHYVKSTYINAVIEREKKFPTGLELDDYGIAIPHTDHKHVNQSTIAIASLKKPIEVHSMIKPQQKIKIKLIFLLAVKEPNKQVQLLSKLMSLFQNKELLHKIEKSKTPTEIYSCINTINYAL